MDELYDKLKRRLRVKSDAAKEELEALVSSCKKEMELKGVYGQETDPTYYQAIVLYCKARFGYDPDSEKFWQAYESLRDSMALSGEYGKA